MIGVRLTLVSLVALLAAAPAGAATLSATIELAGPAGTITDRQLGSARAVVVTGSSGDDTLRIDFRAGDPLPAGGIVYDGRGQTSPAGDSLVIEGGSFETVTYEFWPDRPGGGHSGVIRLDPDGPGGAPAAKIEFRNLEPIANTGTAANIVFDLPDDAADNQTFLEDDAVVGNGSSQIRSGNGTFETTVFANPTNSLVVVASDDGESIELRPLDSGYAADTTLVGGTGNETIFVRATPPGVDTTVAVGEGDDQILVQNLAVGLADIRGPLHVDSGTGTNDLLTVSDFGGTTANANVVLTSTVITGFAGPADEIPIQYGGNIAFLTLEGSDSADERFTASSVPAGAVTNVFARGGIDTLVGPSAGTLFIILGSGAGSLTSVLDYAGVENLVGGAGNDIFAFFDGATTLGTINGGGGTNTLDFSPYTTPVAVNLGSTAPSLSASLAGDQEVPGNASAATGSASLTYNPTAKTFDVSVTVAGINPANVSGFHIHRAPFGVNGPIIVDFGTGALVPSGTGFTFSATDVPIDPLHEAALLGGATYVNVHTPSFPGGEIRGQVFPSAPYAAGPGSATGTAGISNVQNVTGGAGSFTVGAATFGDSIVGNANSNDLRGSAGNDVLVGGRGGDGVFGELGDDLLLWNEGDAGDGFFGDDGTDRVVVAGAASPGTGDALTVTDGGSGVVVRRTNLTPFAVLGSAENVTVLGRGGPDTISQQNLASVSGLVTTNLVGNEGIDALTITGSPGITTSVRGFSGNDTLIVTGTTATGSATFDGGSGLDIAGSRGDTDATLTNTLLSYRSLNIPLVDIERGALTGGASNNVLDASSSSLVVTLTGLAGNDTLAGGSANDTLGGGPGDDTLEGGAGIDTVTESADADFRLENGSLNGLGTDELVSVERANLTGRGSDNTFTVTGWTGIATLNGAGGTDRVVAANDLNFNLTNTSLVRSGLGAVALAGIEEAALAGGWGNNSLNASLFTGNVSLDGREGNDTLNGGTRADTLLGGPGADVLTGRGGEDSFDGGLGVDRVLETADANFVLTNTSLAIASIVDGLTSVEAATLTGGTGANSLDASAFTLGGVVLNGAAGNDSVLGGSRSDTLTGGTGADTMRGSAGDDTLFARDATVDTVVDGGSHNAGDRAQIDPGEPTTGIEIFLP